VPCVVPWGLPDNWHDALNDLNGNRIWDTGEKWDFENANEQTYKPYSGSGSDPNETGWASTYRDGRQDEYFNTYNRDYGRQIEVKATRPQDAPLPGFFYPWRMPNGDGTINDPGDTNKGAKDYKDDIKNCAPTPINLGQEYTLEFGNMVGPTYQGVAKDQGTAKEPPSLMNQDPDARWDPTLNNGKGGIAGSKFANWRDSPRVVTVAVFDPGLVKTIHSGNKDGGQTGQAKITFNNFALLFLEGQETKDDPVRARFLFYTQGNGNTGPAAGGLVRSLVLVQ
jgi:hypothetical protein